MAPQGNPPKLEIPYSAYSVWCMFATPWNLYEVRCVTGVMSHGPPSRISYGLRRVGGGQILIGDLATFWVRVVEAPHVTVSGGRFFMPGVMGRPLCRSGGIVAPQLGHSPKIVILCSVWCMFRHALEFG